MGSPSQQARDAATAGVITRPPLLYLACLILGLALDCVLACRSPCRGRR